MWMQSLLLILLSVAIGWIAFGSVIVLFVVSLFRRNGAPPLPEAYPTLSVIVPVHNAERVIAGRVRNLVACDYPHDRLEILIVDGASTDATLSRLMRVLRPGWPVRLFQAKAVNRIQQINHSLSIARGELVVITDADTRLRPDALKMLAAEFSRDAKCAVVGAYHHVQPESSRDGSLAGLRSRLRQIESDAGVGTTVARACYGFRRSLLSAMPPDVTTDEAYVAIQAATMRQRIVQSRHAVVESFNPRSGLIKLIARCFRANHESVREVMRHVYRSVELSPTMRIMTATRLTRRLLITQLLCAWAALVIGCASMGAWNVIHSCVGILTAAALMTHHLIGRVTTPSGTGRKDTRWLRFDVLLGLFLGTCASSLAYPFIQSSTRRTPAEKPVRMTAKPDESVKPVEPVAPSPLIAAVTSLTPRRQSINLASGRITTRAIPRPVTPARLTPSGCL